MYLGVTNAFARKDGLAMATTARMSMNASPIDTCAVEMRTVSIPRGIIPARANMDGEKMTPTDQQHMDNVTSI